MHPYITKVDIIGLHDRKDLHVELQSGLNILWGRNGAGKTTLLHIIANLVDADIARFRHLAFETISVTTSEDANVELRQIGSPRHGHIQVSIDGDIIDDGEEAPDDDSVPSTPKATRHAFRNIFGGRPVYLPAFRAILEAATKDRYDRYDSRPHESEGFNRIMRDELSFSPKGKSKGRVRSLPRERERAKTVAGKTVYCREWFDGFVPVIRYPSLREVGWELDRELDAALYALAAGDRKTLNKVFIDVLRAVSVSPDASVEGADNESTINTMLETVEALDQVQPEFSDLYSTLTRLLTESGRPALAHGLASPILKVYQDALSQRLTAQQEAFADIRFLENSVNRFLTDKRLSVEADGRTVPRGRRLQNFVLLGKESAPHRRRGFTVLSSGERQVLTLLFTATHMSVSDGVVLVDEPELSLHLDWKRIILGEMMKQAGDRQIIACSHAPEVAAEHRDRLVELCPVPWNPSQSADCDDNLELEADES